MGIRTRTGEAQRRRLSKDVPKSVPAAFGAVPQLPPRCRFLHRRYHRRRHRHGCHSSASAVHFARHHAHADRDHFRTCAGVGRVLLPREGNTALHHDLRRPSWILVAPGRTRRRRRQRPPVHGRDVDEFLERQGQEDHLFRLERAHKIHEETQPHGSRRAHDVHGEMLQPLRSDNVQWRRRRRTQGQEDVATVRLQFQEEICVSTSSSSL
mmetsp:Transcript_23807/g.67345  ORF Transcript_23807/g.67345 Transcript_23807/m.67345 type:complete len:210 (+) Transcript_23807:889-1518(+)